MGANISCTNSAGSRRLKPHKNSCDNSPNQYSQPNKKWNDGIKEMDTILNPETGNSLPESTQGGQSQRVSSANNRIKETQLGSKVVSFNIADLDNVHTDELASFLPITLLHAVVNGKAEGIVLDSFQAAVIFADLYGFTKYIREKQKMPNGAELVGQALNSKFFRPVLKVIKEWGGDVIKFSGDALTIVFPVKDLEGASKTPKDAVLRASRCCVEMQKALQNVKNDGQNDDTKFSLHSGLGYGTVKILQLGGAGGRFEYVLAGRPLTQIEIACPLAHPGETVMSVLAVDEAEDQLVTSRHIVHTCGHASEWLNGLQGVIYERCKKGCWVDLDPLQKLSPQQLEYCENNKEFISNNKTEFAYRVYFSEENIAETEFKKLLDVRSSPDKAVFAPPEIPSHLLEEILKNIPMAIKNPLIDGQKTFDEMRKLSIVFINIPDLDVSTDEGGRVANELMIVAQSLVYDQEGSVNKVIVDDKGFTLLVGFGLPPLPHSDDALRAMKAGQQILRHQLKNLNLKGKLGVTTGDVWCGIVGDSWRREYTVLGDMVNLAARLMAAQENPGLVCDEATFREVGDHLHMVPLKQPIKLKGLPDPVVVFRPTGRHVRRFAFRSTDRRNNTLPLSPSPLTEFTEDNQPIPNKDFLEQQRREAIADFFSGMQQEITPAMKNFIDDVRQVSIVCIKIPSVTVPTDPACNKAQRLVETAVRKQDGEMTDIVIGDSGLTFFFRFGVPPTTCCDIALRALLAACKIVDNLQQMDLRVKVGVSAGIVHRGQGKSKYSGVTNFATLCKGLMEARENPGILCDEATFKDARHRLEMVKLVRPINMPGTPNPVVVYRATGQIKQARLSQWPDWQDDEEVKELISGYAGVVCVKGEGGAGKTSMGERAVESARKQGMVAVSGSNQDPSHPPRNGELAAWRNILKQIIQEERQHWSHKSNWQLLNYFTQMSDKGILEYLTNKDVHGDLWLLYDVFLRCDSSDDSCTFDIPGGRKRICELVYKVIEGFVRERDCFILLHMREGTSIYADDDEDTWQLALDVAKLADDLAEEQATHDFIFCLVCRDTDQSNPTENAHRDQIVRMAEECNALIAMKRFDKKTCTEFLAYLFQQAPEDLPTNLTDYVFDLTGGNPGSIICTKEQLQKKFAHSRNTWNGTKQYWFNLDDVKHVDLWEAVEIHRDMYGTTMASIERLSQRKQLILKCCTALREKTFSAVGALGPVTLGNAMSREDFERHFKELIKIGVLEEVLEETTEDQICRSRYDQRSMSDGQARLFLRRTVGPTQKQHPTRVRSSSEDLVGHPLQLPDSENQELVSIYSNEYRFSSQLTRAVARKLKTSEQRKHADDLARRSTKCEDIKRLSICLSQTTATTHKQADGEGGFTKRSSVCFSETTATTAAASSSSSSHQQADGEGHIVYVLFRQQIDSSQVPCLLQSQQFL
eukprot:gene959-884_t